MIKKFFIGIISCLIVSTAVFASTQNDNLISRIFNIVLGTSPNPDDIYLGDGIDQTSNKPARLNTAGARGNNVNGQNIIIAGGKATGTASGGGILFQTSDPTVSGSTLQTLSTKAYLTRDGDLHVTGSIACGGSCTGGAATALTGLSDVGYYTTTAAGNILVADGAHYNGVSVIGDISLSTAGVTLIENNKVTSAKLTTTGVTAGTYQSSLITVDNAGRVINAASGSLTGLSDVGSATTSAGKILIADGTKFQSVTVGGSCTLTSAGTLSCSGGSGASALTGLTDVTTDYTSGKILVADGSKFNGVAISGSCTITSAGVISCPTVLSPTGISAGTTLAASLTVGTDGRLTNAFRSSLTGLSDVGTATKTAGNLLLADGTNFQSIAMSSGATISSAGAVTLNETDPKVGLVTNGNFCKGTGTQTSCTDSSTYLTGNQTITLSGDVSGSGSTAITTTIGNDKVGSAQLISTAVTPGTYNTGNFTVDADGRITNAASGSLTGLSDVSSATKTAGNLLIADGTNFVSTSMSTAGDATISSAGVLTIQASKITSAKMTTTGVTAGTYQSPLITVDGAGRILNAASGSLTGLSDVSSATKTAGNLLIADGTNFVSTSMSTAGDATLSSAGVLSIQANKIGPTQIASTAVTAGTYNTGNFTVDADGRITNAATGSLTGLSDVSSATKTAGNLLIADGTNFVSTSMSTAGDATITSAGVLSIQANKVTSAKMTNTGVTASTVNAAQVKVDSAGRITAIAASSLTGLSDVTDATKTSGNILIANGTNFVSTSLSSDITLASSGAVNITKINGVAIGGDPLTQYAFLAGRSGGQTLIGGTATTDALNLNPTSATGYSSTINVDSASNNNYGNNNAIGLELWPNGLTVGVATYFSGVRFAGTLTTSAVPFLGLPQLQLFNDTHIHVPAVGIAGMSGDTTIYSAPTLKNPNSVDVNQGGYLGFWMSPTITTTSTGLLSITNARGMLTNLAVGANSTVQSYTGLEFQDASGAGSVTGQYAVDILNLTKGGTDNIGIRSAITAGTGKFFIRETGTAQNTFKGLIAVGTTALPTEAVDVTGNVKATGSLAASSVTTTGGLTLQTGGGLTITDTTAAGTCTSSAATTCTATVRSGCKPVCSQSTSVSTTLRCAVSSTTLTCTFGTSGTNTCNFLCF